MDGMAGSGWVAASTGRMYWKYGWMDGLDLTLEQLGLTLKSEAWHGIALHCIAWHGLLLIAFSFSSKHFWSVSYFLSFF
jgi:hypothetical protein